MRILVISDTHGNYPLALRAADMAEPLDAVIHLGDGADDAALLAQVLEIQVVQVAGNCDLNPDAPGELLWECEGKRLLLTHGDRYGVKSGICRLEQRAVEAGADVVLFGHTHLPLITTLSGVLFVNPGTLMKSSCRRTCAVLEIGPSGAEASLLEIPPL